MNSVYIDSAVPATPIYIGPNNASSIIIGNNNCTTNLIGSLNIGTSTPNTVNIGKEGSSTNLFGFTNLGLVTSGTKSSYIETGAGGGNALFDFHSSGLFDVDYDSRIMSTGGTSSPGQGSLQLFSKTISITSPLTLGAAPSDTTQLGGKITGTINTYAASPFNVASLTITTAGVYIFTFYIELTISATPTSAWINMTGTNMKSSDFGFSYINTANVCFNGSQVISATASGYSLTLQYNNGTGINTNNCFFTATRIA